MKIRLMFYLFFIFFGTSCYSLHKSSGGGQDVEASNQRTITIQDIVLPEGYEIQVVVENLTFPTGIAFDDQGIPYVTESGYSYGEVILEPRLLRIKQEGKTEVVASGEKNGPWNGVWYHEGNFYVAEGGQMEGGKILKIDKQGTIKVLIDSLPSFGDHHTNGPVVRDGYIYFGQGTATNSSVVGNDNFEFGWLKRNPEFHDIPCKDIKLAGTNFTTENVLDKGSKGKVSTGAYLSYGTSSKTGQVISGKVPCSGAVMRIPLNGGEPELVAWGFRNPYGLAYDSNGQLYITDNGYDERGSRPVWGTGDYLWKVETGRWYGWPDFAGGHELNSGHLKVPGKGKPQKILAEYPEEPPHPAAIFAVHSSSNSFDFSRSNNFGFVGEAFVAQFGDMAPKVGKVLQPVGFRVVRVNPETGVIHDFVLNKDKIAPASKIKSNGIERPVAARFSPDGETLYIVDFGILLTSKEGPRPLEKTGVIWKVSKTKKL